MRNKHYRVKCYRLDEEVIEHLDELSADHRLSFNKLFKLLIKSAPKPK